MYFTLTPEQRKLRDDVREFLAVELPREKQTEIRGLAEWADDEEWEFGQQFAKKLATKGWLTAHWPKEYGGQDMPILEQMVLQEELNYNRAPMPNPNGLAQLGPVLMMYGTEKQKREHLPAIAACEETWCQGYSEPNSGSDLASLQTRAALDGDEYVINGQKVWTGCAHRADWMFMMARTDPNAPKHRGISFFILPMSSPGLTVRPLQGMPGFTAFNEEFFEDVRVPRENLIGEENRGWYVGTALLNFERSNVGRVATNRRDVDELTQYVRDSGLIREAGWRAMPIRARIADLAIGVEIGRMLAYRIGSMQSRGEMPVHEASISKTFTSELMQRIAQEGYSLLGLFGQVRPENPRWVKLLGRFTMSIMVSRVFTIGGGTSEIQRNLIATRGLGLARE